MKRILLLTLCLPSLVACEHVAPPVQQGPAVDIYKTLKAFDQVGAVRFPLLRNGSVLPPELHQRLTWTSSKSSHETLTLLAEHIGYTLIDHRRTNHDDMKTVISGINRPINEYLKEFAAVNENYILTVDFNNHIIEVNDNV
ncbi:hypothetical protein [Neokomagataea thailandica]|uniref:Uncharacterized protein n=1 Tax=Neokomagataea tanensis NBRC 106556 TaxID=1223519 RepID=A0ABQ0QL45_9PROT|nr:MULTISPECIES: hypothetical protein [Neokomagataea]GBR48814.1 hypothetical protein AA106556_1889 [Neokomagataea tanensis NBRC 106556]